MSSSPAPFARAVRALLLSPILVYQRVVSPALPRRCKYEPTCSHYAVQAIGRFGILRGSVLAAWRLLRCNPWSHGGYDPVESQRLFGTNLPKHRPHTSHRPDRQAGARR